jgi:hypothetical protein
MKNIIKVAAISLILLNVTSIFCWPWDPPANRQTRGQAGYSTGKDLPSGSYYDQRNGNCIMNLAGNLICQDLFFDKPFRRCPQNGCYNLKVVSNALKEGAGSYTHVDINLKCVDTCNDDADVDLPSNY